MSSTHKRAQDVYEIVVEGELDRDWQQWFNSLAIVPADPAQSSTTTLIGPVSDQAALRGLLCKMWDLNLAVLSVRRVEADSREGGML